MEMKNSLFFEEHKEYEENEEKKIRTFRMEIPYGAPLSEVYECAGKFLDKSVNLINEHAQNNKPKDPDEAPIEECSEDEKSPDEKE